MTKTNASLRSAQVQIEKLLTRLEKLHQNIPKTGVNEPIVNTNCAIFLNTCLTLTDSNILYMEHYVGALIERAEENFRKAEERANELKEEKLKVVETASPESSKKV